MNSKRFGISTASDMAPYILTQLQWDFRPRNQAVWLAYWPMPLFRRKVKCATKPSAVSTQLSLLDFLEWTPFLKIIYLPRESHVDPAKASITSSLQLYATQDHLTGTVLHEKVKHLFFIPMHRSIFPVVSEETSINNNLTRSLRLCYSVHSTTTSADYTK